MIFIGNLLHMIIQIFILLVIVQALLSFVMDPYHPIRQKLNQIVDPFLQPIRRVVPPIAKSRFQPTCIDYHPTAAGWISCPPLFLRGRKISSIKIIFMKRCF